MAVHIGTAGWSIPSALAEQFPNSGTHLERYGSRFSAVEINTSFYRPHQRKTYERWAASVPPEFRFAVKLPRAITHEHRLVDCQALIERFAEETEGLGEKRGPVLVQLPPSLPCPKDVAEGFFASLKTAISGSVVLEPRHPSWFRPEVNHILKQHRISRVAADPARVLSADQPGGWGGLAYFRLHGSPRIYESTYGWTSIESQAKIITDITLNGYDCWVIYDNTTYGAATQNALDLKNILDVRS